MPDDQEQDEERRDVEVRREPHVPAAEPLPPGRRGLDARRAERRTSWRIRGGGVRGRRAGGVPGLHLDIVRHGAVLHGGPCVGELVDVGEERLPGLVGGVAAVIHPDQGGLEGLEDVGVLRALVGLDGDRGGAVAEDLPDRGVVEELVGHVHDRRVVQRVDLAREGADGLEGLHLLLGRRDPGRELLGLVGVLRLLRDGQERAAPVAAAAGEDVGEVPALDALGVAGDHAEHPAGAGHGGEAVLLEGGGPVVAPLGELGGQALRRRSRSTWSRPPRARGSRRRWCCRSARRGSRPG